MTDVSHAYTSLKAACPRTTYNPIRRNSSKQHPKVPAIPNNCALLCGTHHRQPSPTLPINPHPPPIPRHLPSTRPFLHCCDVTAPASPKQRQLKSPTVNTADDCAHHAVESSYFHFPPPLSSPIPSDNMRGDSTADETELQMQAACTALIQCIVCPGARTYTHAHTQTQTRPPLNSHRPQPSAPCFVKYQVTKLQMVLPCFGSLKKG